MNIKVIKAGDFGSIMYIYITNCILISFVINNERQYRKIEMANSFLLQISPFFLHALFLKPVRYTFLFLSAVHFYRALLAASP